MIIFQGGLSSDRNIEALVGAFLEIDRSEACLVVVGDGAELKTLRDTVETNQNGADRSVFFTGWVPKKNCWLTRGADGGVIPYQATCLIGFVLRTKCLNI